VVSWWIVHKSSYPHVRNGELGKTSNGRTSVPEVVTLPSSDDAYKASGFWSYHSLDFMTGFTKYIQYVTKPSNRKTETFLCSRL
jgi:hypothetical protein